MPVNTHLIMRALATLSEEEDLKVSIAHTAKAGLLVGASTMAGGLLLGPLGLAIGGAMGGMYAAVSSKGAFKPVATIIMDMPAERRQELVTNVISALADFNIYDVGMLISLLKSNGQVRDIALQVVQDYVKNNMGLAIK